MQAGLNTIDDLQKKLEQSKLLVKHFKGQYQEELSRRVALENEVKEGANYVIKRYDEKKAAIAGLEKALDALWFYANSENWNPTPESEGHCGYSLIEIDEGDIANEARNKVLDALYTLGKYLTR